MTMWLVQVPYETCEGEQKMMQSEPLYREDAEQLRSHFQHFGHRTNLIAEENTTTKAPTAIHVKTREGGDLALPIDPRECYAALARRGTCDLDFAGIDLGGHSFFGLEFGNADFAHCSLRKSEFTGAVLRNTTLEQAQADLAQFDHAALTEVNAEDGRFATASFRSAHVNESTFDQARARYAVFDGATVRKTSFERADLRGSSWRGATLREVSFLGADLSEADLTGLELEGPVILTGVWLQNVTGLPPRLALHADIEETRPLIQGATRIAPEEIATRKVAVPGGGGTASAIQIAIRKLWLDHAVTGGSLLLQPPRRVADAAIAVAEAIGVTRDINEICRMLGDCRVESPPEESE